MSKALKKINLSKLYTLEVTSSGMEYRLYFTKKQIEKLNKIFNEIQIKIPKNKVL